MDVGAVRAFTRNVAIAVAVICFLPYLFATATAPRASLFSGFTYNFDDQMVYAAWARQAMQGHFLFDNRFTVDPQPGLTVNLFFLVVGWIAKLIGLPLAFTLVRSALAGAAVYLLGRLTWRLTHDSFKTKLAVVLAVFGGGFGFLVWHSFGLNIVRTAPPVFSQVFAGMLPVDVWQPEAMVFPSLLTNALFSFALCLMVGVLYCGLAARESWRPVPYGAVGMLLLMNVHSYDVAILGVVLVGLLVMAFGTPAFSKEWLLRLGVIALGAVPTGLYLLYVLKTDPVFAARAGVATYAPSANQLVSGIAPLAGLAVSRLILAKAGRERRAGGIAVLALLGLLLVLSNPKTDAYWLQWGPWLLMFGAALCVCKLLASHSQEENALWAWAVLGLVLIYAPVAVQRKFGMMIALPWGILGALGLASLLQQTEKGQRNLVTLLAMLVCSASSLLWFFRDIQVYIRADVSNTTMHPVYFRRDTKAILDYLNKNGSPSMRVLAMPGIAHPHETSPDVFKTPYLPDLNPIIAGFTGAYTFAGHWGETPDYEKKRRQASLFFLDVVTDTQRKEFLDKYKIDYVVAPVPLAFPEVEVFIRGPALADLETLGEVVYPGDRFLLLKVHR